MAKILDTKKYIQENINIRKTIEKNNSNSRLVDSTETYTNYFRQQEIESMHSILGIDQYIGDRSPIRFSEIIDFPIFISQATSLDISLEEQGIEPEFNFDAGVQQGTIIPLVNDFLYIKYLSNKYLFRVTNVTTDTLRDTNVHFYKINLELSKIHSYDAIKRQVTEVLVALEDNIGTEKRVIITKKEDDLLLQINEQYEYLQNMYINFFYKRKFSSFICDEKLYKDISVKYVCFHSEYFIKRHKLMYSKNDTGSIMIVLDSRKELEYYPEYSNSIYGSIEKGDIYKLKYRVFHEHEIEDKLSVLGGYRNRFMNLVPSNNGWSKDIYFVDDLINKIKSNHLYHEADNKPLENLIISYYNNDIRSIIDFKNYTFTSNLHSYMFIPLALFILSFIKQNILIKITKGGNKLCLNF